MTRIAIIGAGLAGLTLARKLEQHADITVFEKSRGVGGRMATRYADPYEFDHGAQFFTARTRAFREFLGPLIEAGAVATWNARFVELDRDRETARRQWDDQYPHFVGSPRMNSVAAHLSRELHVVTETTVTECSAVRQGWELHDSDGNRHGPFDWVAVTAPPVQAARLLPSADGLRQAAVARPMSACYAVMLGFAAPLDTGWDAARVLNADISWVSVNSSKPGRGAAFTLLVHSTNAWADANLGQAPESVLDYLLDETAAVVGSSVRRAQFVKLHRWRYANIGRQGDTMGLVDAEQRLAVCGDWFIRGRVEAAFRSAAHLADTLIERL